MAMSSTSKPRILREVSFRYSNRAVFYCIWMGGWLLFGLCGFLFGEGFTEAAAIPLIDRYGTAGFVGVLAGIVGGYIFSLSLIFLLARRVTDRRGTALFCNDYAELHMGGRRLRIEYGDVEKLKYRTVFNKQYGGVGLGPMLYRLHIRTKRRKVVIPCSFKEAWECRKAGDAPPDIAELCRQFEARTGLEAKRVVR